MMGCCVVKHVRVRVPTPLRINDAKGSTPKIVRKPFSMRSHIDTRRTTNHHDDQHLATIKTTVVGNHRIITDFCIFFYCNLAVARRNCDRPKTTCLSGRWRGTDHRPVKGLIGRSSHFRQIRFRLDGRRARNNHALDTGFYFSANNPHQ
jgi:hypothetical protein